LTRDNPFYIIIEHVIIIYLIIRREYQVATDFKEEIRKNYLFIGDTISEIREENFSAKKVKEILNRSLINFNSILNLLVAEIELLKKNQTK